MDFGELVERQHGVVSRRQALVHLRPDIVDRRVRSGRWQAAHYGVYLIHSGPIGHQQRRWIASLAAGAGRAALLGGLSALETCGLKGFPVEDIHVLVPAVRTMRAPPVGVTVHRTTLLVPEDLQRLADPPGTAAARSLIDAAQWAATDELARAIVAAGFQQRLVRAESVAAVLDRTRRARGRSLIVEAVREATAGAHSVIEAEFLRLCRRSRLPRPELQHGRRGADRRQRYLDAYFADWGVHVEIDGVQHTEVRQWWADMHRQNELWIPGDRVLRFPAWAIRQRSEVVAIQLRSALQAAGWTQPRTTDHTMFP
jgi:hypothetical protein